MLKRAVARAVAVVLGIGLVACGRPLSPPVKFERPGPDSTNRTVHAHLTMRVEGAQSFSYSGDALLAIYEIKGKTAPRATWFLSISDGILKLPDGRIATFDSDLAPGIYHGPDRYTISATSQNNPAGVPNPFAGGAAYVSLITSTSPRPLRFDRLLSNCVLVVATEQRTGSVRCPALGDGKGGTVSANWSWELT